MTRSQIRTFVQERLDNTSFDTTKLNDFINQIEDDVAIRGRGYWPYLNAEITQALTPGTITYTVPVSFQVIEKIVDETNQNKVLQQISLDEWLNLRELIANNTAAEDNPEKYAIWNNKIYLHPNPNNADTLRIYYQSIQTNVASDSDTPQIPARYHRQVLAQGVYALALEHDDDPKFPQAKAEYREGVQNMMNELLFETLDDTAAIIPVANGAVTDNR